ncbi:putative HAD superfamily hydrolase [Hypoxylon sp. NC1633]|nr:putative HAD superfamily hydrolase [Hypoxylon sp. NC1633]
MKAIRFPRSAAEAWSILRPHHTPTPSCPMRAASSFVARPRRGGPARYLPPVIRPGTVTSSRAYSVSHRAKEAGSSPKPPPFAFAFDIDGVLLHVAKPIPGATKTLEYLQKHNIPFILLTNGGGKHETDRVADLSARLGVRLSTDNFIQSHTPFQELVDRGPDGEAGQGLRDKNILVTGSDAARCREIAERYGFRHVITPADILAAYPDIWPFDPLLAELYAATARPLPDHDHAPHHPPKIDAVFVFNDPRDWALDIQLITDLLLSRNGVLGTYSPRNGKGGAGAAGTDNHGWQRDGQPPLYFSNPDLLWSAAYAQPRLGQGAFQAALAGVWAEITGGAAALERTTIGKPSARTYAYAERALDAHRARALALGNEQLGKERVGKEKAELEPLRAVYMVGDNPASDIRGANEYASPAGTPWTSVLVRTGVWNPERGGDPAFRPAAIVDDVQGAVEWALRREGWGGMV